MKKVMLLLFIFTISVSLFPKKTLGEVQSNNIAGLQYNSFNQGETNTDASPYDDPEKDSDLSEENTEVLNSHAYALDYLKLETPFLHFRINMLTCNYSVALPPPERV